MKRIEILQWCLTVLSYLVICNSNAQSLSTAKHRALLFAVDTYQYLSDLDNPVQNARNIAAELEEHYGFQTEIVINPTIDEIDQKISAYHNGYANGTYPADGQLLLYFSGHGVQEGVNGYFMASDSDPARPQRTAMEYDYYRNQIDQINCQHILVAIDACHSATFDPNYGLRNDNRRFRRKGEENYDRILANHKSYRARCFWTSDGLGKETPDRSTFAYQMLEGLRSHTSSNGYLRSSELFSVYLEKANPIPGGGNFGSDEPAACFLFFKKVIQPIDVGDVSQREKDLQAWQQAARTNSISAYQTYLRSYPRGLFHPQANEKIRELADQTNWDIAQAQNTPAAYEEYLNRHPEGKYAREARKLANPTPEVFPGMDFIQGDTFKMGDQFGDGEDDEDLHTVTVGDYYLGRHEVTLEEFSTFVASSGYKTDAETEGGSYLWNGEKWERKSGVDWRDDTQGNTRRSSEYNHPVIHVSWNDAVAYCNWRSEQEKLTPVYRISGSNVTANWDANGYRLPTEAEWEYAARERGAKVRFGNGKDIADASEMNFDAREPYKESYSRAGRYLAKTVKVGSYEANSQRLYDISGNVWEWCWDWYDSDYYSASDGTTDPHGPDEGSDRVYRGGGWSDTARLCRATFRDFDSPTYGNYGIGFRLARSSH